MHGHRLKYRSWQLKRCRQVATASCAHADTRPQLTRVQQAGEPVLAHAAMSVLLQLLQDNASAVFTSLVVVLAGAYLLLTLRRIQAEGSCPFARSKASVAAPPPPTAAGSAPATQKRHRNAMVRLTLAELADFDGKDASKPLYVAVRGKIYDVSPGRSFYGPGAVLALAPGGWLRAGCACCVLCVCCGACRLRQHTCRGVGWGSSR